MKIVGVNIGALTVKVVALQGKDKRSAVMPILTYESDGYAVSPSFLRQVEVHTQQVLEHRARKPIQNAA